MGGGVQGGQEGPVILPDAGYQVLAEDLAPLQKARRRELGSRTASRLVQQRLNGELVIRLPANVLEGRGVALLAEVVGARVHGFDPAHTALLKALAHHVLDTLLDLGEGHSLRAVVQHAHDGVHAAEPLGQHLVLVGQHKARGPRLGQGEEALIGRHLFTT